MDINYKDYAYKPYPTKTQEEREVFGLSYEEIGALSHENRRKVNTAKADYVGKIQSHRFENRGNYDFLELRMAKEDSQDVKNLIDNILQDHYEKERGINTMTINKAFHALEYAKRRA